MRPDDTENDRQYRGAEEDERRLTSTRHQEKEAVCQTRQLWMRDRQQSDKTNRSDAVWGEDERPAILSPITPQRDHNSRNASNHIDWHRQQLRSPRLEAETFDDGWGEEAKGVEGNALTADGDAPDPELPVTQRASESSETEAVMIVDLTVFGAGVFLQATFDDLGFGFGEPFGVPRGVGEYEVDGAANEDGGNAFEVEADAS